MSEERNLEARLAAWAAAAGDPGDWNDVLLRAGERPLRRRVPRRRFVLALAAAALILGAALAGFFVTSGTHRTGSPGSAGATGVNGATGAGAKMGPTGNVGPTGYVGSTGDHSTSQGPVAMTQSELAAKSTALGAPIYWAGPVEGNTYEFIRTAQGFLYVRYLPPGALPGTRGGAFRIVATYPLARAFSVLKERADGKIVSGPDGSIIVVKANDPKEVVLAFPNVDYEVEIYDPSPGKALAVAQSGMIRPVAG